MQNVISRQVRFERVTNFEFDVVFQNRMVGTVRPVVVDGARKWQVNDEVKTRSDTREMAATKYLVAQNLLLS